MPFYFMNLNYCREKVRTMVAGADPEEICRVLFVNFETV
jgi:hypothetical protein